MTTYFKATRPNGRDFRTNTVDYAAICGTGEQLPTLNGTKCCEAGVYHASVYAAETLIGGSWPCRLFEVEGEPVSSEGHKRGLHTFRVSREVDATLALGPNGAEVAAFIKRASELTIGEIDAFNVWARNAARSTAWAARDAARYAAWDAARDAAWDAAWRTAWGAARGPAVDAAVNAARSAAWAAVSAVSALVVKDLIRKKDFDTLYGHWASVIDS